MWNKRRWVWVLMSIKSMLCYKVLHYTALLTKIYTWMAKERIDFIFYPNQVWDQSEVSGLVTSYSMRTSQPVFRTISKRDKTSYTWQPRIWWIIEWHLFCLHFPGFCGLRTRDKIVRKNTKKYLYYFYVLYLFYISYTFFSRYMYFSCQDVIFLDLNL